MPFVFQNLYVKATATVHIIFSLRRGEQKRQNPQRDMLGNHRRQSTQSRVEHGLGISPGSRRSNNLDCGRSWVRKAFHRACGRIADCVRGIAKGDTRVRGEFDLINHFVVAVWTAGEAKSATYENECSASNSYSLAHMLRVFATGRGSRTAAGRRLPWRQYGGRTQCAFFAHQRQKQHGPWRVCAL